MTPIEFLEHDDVKRPIQWEDTDDLLRRIRQRLDDYLVVARKLDQSELPVDKKLDIEHMKMICNKIVRSMGKYLRGDLEAAYRGMNDLFRLTVQSELAAIQKGLGRPVKGGGAVSFRLRESDSPLMASGETFHVPIQNRHWIDSNRFSVPGLPTLYLGGSLLTCWHELGRPSFEKTYAAAIWMDHGQECRVFNLSYTPEVINSYLPHVEKYFFEERAAELAGDLLFQWPLLMCCLIPVKHTTSPFKPEYMLPQGLMAFVSHQKEVDAVAFPSSKFPIQTFDQVEPSLNYAFPISGEVSHGYDPKLKQMFRSTPPVQWSMLTSLDDPMANHPTSKQIEIAPGIHVPQNPTAFGKAEANLISIVEKIQSGQIAGHGRILAPVS